MEKSENSIKEYRKLSFCLGIQISSDIVNEIRNVGIDAEQTFNCR